MPDTLDREKAAVTGFPIEDSLARRWSPCSFRDESLTRDQVGSLFEAARWSASSFNDQPWRFIYALRAENPADFACILSTLMEGNQMWAGQASLLAVVCASMTSSRTGKENSKAVYDTGQAVANLCTQATAMGLHVHQMGGFSAERARAELQVPEDWQPVVALAVGHRGAPEDLDPQLQQREFSTRERLPLGRIVFRGSSRQAAGLD